MTYVTYWISRIPLWVLFVPLTMLVAYFKGRRLVLWGILGYFFGPVALVIVLVRANLPRKEYGWMLWLAQRRKSREIEKKFDGLGTTQDFLREIDNDKKDEK